MTRDQRTVEGGYGDAWSHPLGRYVPVRVAAVAETAAAFAEAVLHVYRNESAWEELSLNGARYARSGRPSLCGSDAIAATWVKGHITDQQVQRGEYTARDQKHNSIADALADRGARSRSACTWTAVRWACYCDTDSFIAG